MTASFRFEYGNYISFGTDSNHDPLSTTNLMLMPGLGLQVRTVGKVSAEFGISMLFGIVQVTADEDLYKPSLSEGESVWVFYPVLSLEPAIVWSPTVHWSVKFRLIEFNMNLAGSLRIRKCFLRNRGEYRPAQFPAAGCILPLVRAGIHRCGKLSILRNRPGIDYECRLFPGGHDVVPQSDRPGLNTLTHGDFTDLLSALAVMQSKGSVVPAENQGSAPQHRMGP